YCGLLHVGGQGAFTQNRFQVFGGTTAGGGAVTTQAQAFPGSHLPVGDVQTGVVAVHLHPHTAGGHSTAVEPVAVGGVDHVRQLAAHHQPGALDSVDDGCT